MLCNAQDCSGYTPKIHFRCRFSSFREVCNVLVQRFGDPLVVRLRQLHINQFLRLPVMPQNVPLIHMLISKWDMKTESFIIKGRSLKFSTEEVAILIGMPNRGIIFDVGSAKSTGKTSNDIRHDIERLDSSTRLDDVVKCFLLYLLSNIFYPMANFRIPVSIFELLNTPELFNQYNWPESIKGFLVEEFNVVATKQAKGLGLGYVNGLVMILIIWFLEHTTIHAVQDDLSRPRFTRWDGNFIYTEKEVINIFADLEEHEILTELQGITDAEKDLLLHLSPPTSPIKEPSPSRVPCPTTAESTQTTPASPVGMSSPPEHDSPTPTPVRPVLFTSTSHPDSSAEPESTNVDDQANFVLLNKSIFELFNKYNFIQKKVAEVEATNQIQEHRIHFLEDSMFDLEKENSNLKEKIKKKDDFLMQFFEDQFPSYLKNYKKEMCAPSSVSPTASEETTLSEYEVDTSILSGIAQRVQRRNGRKRKLVSTPFTTGVRKKKIKKKVLSEELALVASAGDRPDEVPEKAAVHTTTPASQPPPEPTPTSPIVIPEPHEQEDVPVVDQPVVKEAVVYEVDENIEIPRAPAAEMLDYPGRALISEDKRVIIDNALKQFKFKNDSIFEFGNISINRSQLDELLMAEELDNNHIDAFAHLLTQKESAFPGRNQPFLFVSSFHWLYYKQYNDSNTKTFVSNIDKTIIRNINLIFVPIIYEKYWTLLLCNLLKKRWEFYDSLPKKTHKAILPEVISHFYEDTDDAFDIDITKWPIKGFRNVPTQNNNVDCGMYLCKYIEVLIQKEPIKWYRYLDWHSNMSLYRAEFAYDLLCTKIQ
ncbi:hypothetical protein KFK09_027609 [Dendrobium nobile]|uniref:Ubiquitin-like protease family profile domain-containing protein n=1 Tax=Dendrobium nobile TaxID=94219 RepID=A0A8T3AC12_DENNO|nr:hypothetical protein KFK09_027609 [Dendrobium nobile]